MSEGIGRKDYGKLYIHCMQAVHTYWMGRLPMSNAMLLMFIIDRTLKWGKTHERISYGQMHTGVTTSYGEEVSAGLNMSLRAIFYAVGRLEKYGFVCVTRSKNSVFGHRSNTFEINCKMILAKDDTMLHTKIIRNKIRAVNKVTPFCKIDTTPSAKKTLPFCKIDTTNIHKENIHKDNILKEQLNSHPEFNSITEALNFSSDKITKARAIKVTRARERSAHGHWKALKMEDILSLWKEAMLAHYPNIPYDGFTVVEFGKFKKALKVGTSNLNVPEFFDWLIGNWLALRNGKLAWLNIKKESMPMRPSIEVLTRYLRLFVKLYTEFKVEVTAVAPRRNVSKEERLELELAAAQATIARQIETERKLKQDNQRLATAPLYVRPRPLGRPVNERTLEEARRIYNEED